MVQRHLQHEVASRIGCRAVPSCSPPGVSGSDVVSAATVGMFRPRRSSAPDAQLNGAARGRGDPRRPSHRRQNCTVASIPPPEPVGGSSPSAHDSAHQARSPQHVPAAYGAALDAQQRAGAQPPAPGRPRASTARRCSPWRNSDGRVPPPVKPARRPARPRRRRPRTRRPGPGGGRRRRRRPGVGRDRVGAVARTHRERVVDDPAARRVPGRRGRLVQGRRCARSAA